MRCAHASSGNSPHANDDEASSELGGRGFCANAPKAMENSMASRRALLGKLSSSNQRNCATLSEECLREQNPYPLTGMFAGEHINRMEWSASLSLRAV